MERNVLFSQLEGVASFRALRRDIYMFDFASMPQKHVAVYAAILALGGTLGGYAIHEHHTAQNLAAKNEQTTAALNETRHELLDLTTKVNMLVARSEAPASPAASTPVVTTSRPAAPRVRREDPHFKKLQSQIDAQGKA